MARLHTNVSVIAATGQTATRDHSDQGILSESNFFRPDRPDSAPRRHQTRAATRRTLTADDFAKAADLRRKRQRTVTDELVRRAELLGPADAELLCAVYRDGRSPADLARLMGVNPRTVRVRIRRLIARLNDPLTLFVAARRRDWPRARSRVATALICHGKPMRRAARELGLTLHQIRQHESTIRTLYEAERAAAEDARAEGDTAHDLPESEVA